MGEDHLPHQQVNERKRKMNLIKEEVLEQLAKQGYNPLEEKLTDFYKGVRNNGVYYEASLGKDRRKYLITQSERSHCSDGGVVECECQWTSEEQQYGDRWIAKDDFIKDGWKSYDLYGQQRGYRFPGYTGQCQRVNWDWGFAILWNLLVEGGAEAVRKYKAQRALETKIEESKRQIQRRTADPAWQQLKRTTQKLIQEGKVGKEKARKLIKDYLLKEKQNQR